jgi:hypothetical protein
VNKKSKRQMVIMKFRKFVKNINESVKEISLNRILDKISKRDTISDGERNFLDNYSKVDDKDYNMISKEQVVKIIHTLIDSGREVICNLYDRDGLVSKRIVSIDNNFQDDESSLVLKGGEVFKMEDRFLYNLIWDMDKDLYSLKSHSEYYEKIPISNK